MQISNSGFYVEPISEILPVTEQQGGLFLGSEEAARDLSLLKRLSISAVLSLSPESKISYSKKDSIAHMSLPSLDEEDYNLAQHFGPAFHFIEESRHWTSVLVHCQVGVSRSPTIAIGYLMWKYCWPTADAYSLVKQKRTLTCPNFGFCQQLKSYEAFIIRAKEDFESSTRASSVNFMQPYQGYRPQPVKSNYQELFEEEESQRQSSQHFDQRLLIYDTHPKIDKSRRQIVRSGYDCDQSDVSYVDYGEPRMSQIYSYRMQSYSNRDLDYQYQRPNQVYRQSAKRHRDRYAFQQPVRGGQRDWVQSRPYQPLRASRFDGGMRASRMQAEVLRKSVMRSTRRRIRSVDPWQASMLRASRMNAAYQA